MAKTQPTGGTPSAKPTSEKKAKGSKRPQHPLVGNKDPKVFPFATMPKDYSFSVHAPLKKKSFSTTSAFFTYKAADLRHKADQMDLRAKESVGDGAGTGLSKKLVKFQQKMLELRAKLKESGMSDADLDKMIASAAVPTVAAA